MNSPDEVMSWQSTLQPLLEDYLRRIGMRSAEVRARWVAHVLAGLYLHIGDFAADDIAEQAVERMRDAIDARLALVANLDRRHERREIAAVLAVLQNEQHAELVNSLFRNFESTAVAELRDHLRDAIRADRPCPVPPDAPLAMPTQSIELRSLIPWRRLQRASQ